MILLYFHSDIFNENDTEKKKPEYRLLLQEDDCAPDSLKYFSKQFYDLFGKWMSTFTEKIKPVDLGDTFVYNFIHKKNSYKLTCEIGKWKLEIKDNPNIVAPVPQCPKCTNEALANHNCPYKADLYGDYKTTCNCCPDCQQECRNDL